MRFFSHIPAILKNKYLITGLFFIVWMLFFDPKDLVSDFSRRAKLHELQDSRQRLRELIKSSNQELYLLKNNAQSIEQYAREKYLMKKDNEDLFIVKSAPENK